MARLKHLKGKPEHFIRQWRKHRGLTLERLADRLEITAGALSNVERGDSGYTQPLLEALAYALQCEPADLIMRDPTEEAAIWSIWDKVPELYRHSPVNQAKNHLIHYNYTSPPRCGFFMGGINYFSPTIK